MARASLLTDEVWAQLKPEDARLTSLGRRQLATAAIAVVLLVSLAAIAQLSGVLTPQLSTGSGSASSGGGHFSQTIEIENNGWFDVHISAIDSHARGAQVVSTKGVGAVVPSGGSITISVEYRIVDCSGVRARDAAPINVRVHRPWGTRTVTMRSGGDSAGLAWVACGHRPPGMR